METFSPIELLTNYGGAVVLATLIAESYLAYVWNEKWTQIGIIGFQWSIDVEKGAPFLLSTTRLEYNTRSSLFGKLLFQRLDENTIAFREAMLYFRLLCYLPLMHGIIRFDRGHGQAIIQGRLYWFNIPLVILLGLLYKDNFQMNNTALFVKCVIAGFSLLYFLQLCQFIRVIALLRSKIGFHVEEAAKL